MPPFIPKKRLATTPPPETQSTPVKKLKATDAPKVESSKTASVQKPKPRPIPSDDSDTSSLSDVDSDEFEDVPVPAESGAARTQQNEGETDADEDDDFEDVELGHAPSEQSKAPDESMFQDVQVKINRPEEDDMGAFSSRTKSGKQGPTKREKAVRACTHQLHVQFLLWHNTVRNRWVNDKVVQQTLLDQLPPQIRKEVEKWKRASGLLDQRTEENKNVKKNKKGKKGKPPNPREERDWGRPSERLEAGKADMSQGDPLISLLKVLAAYWKKRYHIVAPGLRKRGYSSILELKREVRSFRNDEHDREKHGERIRNIQEFREIATACEGSRDTGAQLFTALLRGLGIDSRLVANLQPAGFGFTKAEQMVPRKLLDSTPDVMPTNDQQGSSKVKAEVASKRTPAKHETKSHSARTRKGLKETPIDLDSDIDEDDTDSSQGDSVVDVTPSLPKQRPAKYDTDLAFPVYWTEAISPITNKAIPVSPLVLEKPVAATEETLVQFEPKGAKAENARLVIAYVIAYSSDGTAKDVTVRYLRKHIWPGKTRPFRFPVEKIPVYDRHGRIKRYEDYDWFKHTLSPYTRSDNKRTAVDDIEDTTDLVPQEPQKKEVDEGIDTLQSLKASADFVLERFLRREEAIRPGAKSDRVFVSGKGDNIKEELVYRRANVERCMTAESWHKEGRHPKLDAEPIKMVPVRAVTLTRKREAEDYLRATGEKQLQGLYSWDQTEYIIPPPIEDGIIPKNAYGNMDCFVPSMVPKGATHIPLRGTVRICKKLEIDYAEAVVGFEFGNKRAVPVVRGVVVASENAKRLREEWKKFEAERKRREDAKMEKVVLDLWRKFVIGLRIRERLGMSHGYMTDAEAESAARGGGMTMEDPIDVDVDQEDQQELRGGVEDGSELGGGFLLPHEDDIPNHEDLVMEDHASEEEPFPSSRRKGRAKALEADADADAAGAQYPTPTSMSTTAPARAVQQPKDRTKEMKMQQEQRDDDDSSALSTVAETPELEPSASEGETEADQDDGASGSHRDSDEDDDDYRPSQTPARKSQKPLATRDPSVPSRGGPSRRRRSGRVASAAATSRLAGPALAVDGGGAETQARTSGPRANRGRRRAKAVTSPYFAQVSE